MTPRGVTHVAIDARELTGHVTGPGTYLLNLLRHWLTDESLRLTLIAHQPLSPEVDALPGHERLARVVRSNATGGTAWEQLVLPRAAAPLGAAVLFSPAYTAPLATRLPTVVAMHDVSFAAHPQWFRPSERLRRNTISRLAARRAARVTTLSAFSAGEIARLFGLDRAAIAVIPPGAPPRAPTPSMPAAREPLVVYVGSILNRRHVPLLIEAFARVARARPDASLFIAGANRTWPHEDIGGLIGASTARRRITWLEDASNALVSDALSRASAGVFLSAYEGFAMTPFEALAHGVPSVLLDTPVAREVYGDAALRVDLDAAGVAAALLRLLDDAAARDAIVARGASLWEKYDWAASAAAMRDVLREAAR